MVPVLYSAIKELKMKSIGTFYGFETFTLNLLVVI